MSGTTKPIKIFYSYSHKDEWLRQELGKHLAALRQERLIEDWHDRRILAGENWEQAIADQLERADLVLLLISSDFIDSRYCYGIEMAKAIERSQAGSAQVIPIIVRACYWKPTPIGKLKVQAIPRDAKPVTSWSNIDEAFLSVVEAIFDVIQKGSGGEPDGGGKLVRPAAAAPRPGLRALAAAAAKRWNVPYARNRYFTGRESLITHVTPGLATGRPVILYGDGGVGKSAVAVEYAHRHRRDYRLVWWIRAGTRETAFADYVALAEALNLPVAPREDHEALVSAVHDWLSNNPDWLLLFDNARDRAGLAEIIPSARTGHVIATSRSRQWDASVEALEVKSWSREDSIAYLLARTDENDREAANSIADAYCDMPLALEQATAYVEQEKARAA
jgi:hypothetical protein